MLERQIIIVAHDIRSTHNIGSLLRTAEGLGVTHVYLTGYTPYPILEKDDRLPHIAQKLDKQIHKTALDAENLIQWSHEPEVLGLLKRLRQDGFQIVGLEQTTTSVPLPSFSPGAKVVIVLGREVEGIDPELLAHCDVTIEIPMFGKKESFNVVQATAMAIYQCRFAAL